MGILKHLLFWPVTGPKALVDFTVRQVDGVVQRELTDDDRVKEDLMALQMELELGDIDEDEYLVREAALMERLREARAWRTELGLEEEWAPLEFPRHEDDDGDASGAADARGGPEPWSPDSSSTSPRDSSSS